LDNITKTETKPNTNIRMMHDGKIVYLENLPEEAINKLIYNNKAAWLNKIARRLNTAIIELRGTIDTKRTNRSRKEYTQLYSDMNDVAQLRKLIRQFIAEFNKLCKH